MRALETRFCQFSALCALFGLYVAMRPLGVHVSDSYAYVNSVDKEAFGYFFHPHHLLYVPLAWRWNQLVRLVAPSTPSWAAVATMSAAFGCLGIAAVYRTLCLLGARPLAASAGSALVAVTFGYWFFSSDAEVYVVSASALLWAVYFLARFTISPQKRWLFWAGIVSGLATVLHQTGIFMLLPAAIVLLGLRKRSNCAASFFLFFSAFSIVVAPCYVAAAWASLPVFGLNEFLAWIFLFAGKGYGGWNLGEMVRSPVGFARAIVGGQLIIDFLRGVRQAGALLWLGGGCAAAGLAVFGAFIVRAAAGFRGASPAVRNMTLGVLGGFALYAAFGVYFDAINFEWWTIPVTLLTLAASCIVLTGDRPYAGTAAVAALLIAAANLTLDFSYRRRPDCDFVRNAAREIVALTRDCDVIIAPSYLGVLIWAEAPGRNVFCPDEALRLVGADGMRRQLESALRPCADGPVDIVAAGLQADAPTMEFWESLTAGAPESAIRTIGTFIFLDGSRGLVSRVSAVPVVAIPARVVTGRLPQPVAAAQAEAGL